MTPTGPGAALIRADALRLPLADDSVDLIVTSPPYFGLRSYTDAGEHYTGQIGSEPGPAEFLAALWAATAEMKRVLKPGGSIFVNLGDKYAGGGGYSPDAPSNVANRKRAIGSSIRDGRPVEGIRDKSLLLLPEAYRLGCTGMLAALGGPDPGLNLIARAVIVWDKPNGLPESVRDRVRRSHEDWVHLTKQPRYYSAVDEIREPHTWGREINPAWSETRKAWGNGSQGKPQKNDSFNSMNPLGKLPGSVWTVPSEPLRLPEHLGIQHYAAFASEWPRRLILGFSPPGICCECGQGRAPVVDSQRLKDGEPTDRGAIFGKDGKHSDVGNGGHWRYETERLILGYACACTPHTDHPGSGESSGPSHAELIASGRASIGTWAGPDATKLQKALGGAYSNRPRVGGWREYHLTGWTPPPTRPAVVLDPFAGTGTTVMVARALGRFGVGIDLSSDYLRAARWRIWDSGHHAKAITRTNLERQGVLL